MRDITNLDCCASLVDLSLAWNDVRLAIECCSLFVPFEHLPPSSFSQITAIKGLESLTLLRRLDLSHNKIKQIGGGLATLTTLQWLDLKDNLLERVEDLQALKPLTALTALSLQSCDGEDCNPMCLLPTYTLAAVLAVVPGLATWDGGHVLVHEAYDEIERAAAGGGNGGNAGEASDADAGVDAWFDPLDLFVEDAAVLASTTGAKGDNALLAGLGRTDEMLKADCTMLLRKADAAISKAKSAL